MTVFIVDISDCRFFFLLSMFYFFTMVRLGKFVDLHPITFSDIFLTPNFAAEVSVAKCLYGMEFLAESQIQNFRSL